MAKESAGGIMVLWEKKKLVLPVAAVMAFVGIVFAAGRNLEKVEHRQDAVDQELRLLDSAQKDTSRRLWQHITSTRADDVRDSMRTEALLQTLKDLKDDLTYIKRRIR